MQANFDKGVTRRAFLPLMAGAALAVAGMTAGCSSDDSGSSDGSSDSASPVETTKKVRLGIKSDYTDMMNMLKGKIEDLGYTVEITAFQDFVQPNNALVEGSIDINFLQHEPYMAAYNKSYGSDLAMVRPKTIYNIFGLYSNKWGSVDEIPDGATVGLCNDPSNKQRGLELLEAGGLIKVKEGVDSPTQYDIEENPKNLQFIEAEISALPQTIDDCDAIAVAALQMVNTNRDPKSYLYCLDDANNEEYAIGFVVDGKYKDSEWATGIAKAVQCDELEEYLATYRDGAQLPAWK